MLRGTLYGLFMTALATPTLAQMDLPRDLPDGFYVTLDEIRANSQKVFQAFAGSEGGPISMADFTSKKLPADVVPAQPDRRCRACSTVSMPMATGASVSGGGTRASTRISRSQMRTVMAESQPKRSPMRGRT